jgi:ribonuclease P protein component
MLKRKFRLPKETQFKQAYQTRTPIFTLRTVSNGLAYNRYSFVVSKQVDKRAVARNRLKRRARACVESWLQAEHGQDRLFVLRKEALTKTTPEIWSAITAVLNK